MLDIDDDEDDELLFCENCGAFDYDVENCDGCGLLYCMNCIDWHVIEDCDEENKDN